MQNLLPLLIIFFCLNTYSNPMPLGLELNKTTNIDLTKKYKIINKEPNYWQGYNYYIEPNEKAISKALVICNDFNVIEAVILTIDKNKFEEFYNILKDKVVTFKDGECLIILESSELNTEMELVYITNGFYKEFLNKLDKEEKLEQEQMKRLL
ncbi:hypothetical protein RFEPED_0124 [Rickettsia felis str. Pedreira]|uniref:Uncharacterized protein n=2 Tax=Rickettsia felis TaxID=42862 RepID=A0A0F3MQP0_RICFI|nr:hypothetical protein [Rickettsia felis]AAY61529.1 unknown [Rickettsia felis URRWXCal2]KJV57757.1 hypothetical protein RFEPED_0124 [Rickettsia felis str. Pedreira]MDE8610894.1 hypothetical protein [Rickettsia felis]